MRAVEILKEYYYGYGAWYDSNNHQEHDVSDLDYTHTEWMRNNTTLDDLDSYDEMFDNGFLRIVTSQRNGLYLGVMGNRETFIKSKSYINKLIRELSKHPAYETQGARVNFDFKGIDRDYEDFYLPNEMRKLNEYINNGFK